ncbi:uncharacterized protein LOC120350973 [Nilaparvata lugens]|uniref:uncharacterized protein LOC120350973 n=1 Tax=Nilaparvata lugens TaxID=108931 RepID=UPI00193DB92E|nr:uncharacterized protein LOC120350973 [Nilaparvata lugens]
MFMNVVWLLYPHHNASAVPCSYCIPTILPRSCLSAMVEAVMVVARLYLRERQFGLDYMWGREELSAMVMSVVVVGLRGREELYFMIIVVVAFGELCLQGR